MNRISLTWKRFHSAVNAVHETILLESISRLMPRESNQVQNPLDEDQQEVLRTWTLAKSRAISQLWRNYQDAWELFLDRTVEEIRSQGIFDPDDPPLDRLGFSIAVAFALLVEENAVAPRAEFMEELRGFSQAIIEFSEGQAHNWGTEASRAAEMVLAMFGGWLPAPFEELLAAYPKLLAQQVFLHTFIDHLLDLIIFLRRELYAKPYFLFFPIRSRPDQPPGTNYPNVDSQQNRLRAYLPYWSQQLVSQFLSPRPSPFPASNGRQGNNQERQMAHRLRSHYLISWDPINFELWKFIRQAVIGTFRQEIQPGGVSSSMAFPLLQEDCGLEWKQRAVFLCPQCHCGEPAKRRPMTNWISSSRCTFCDFALANPCTEKNRGLITTPFFQELPCVRCSGNCCDCGKHDHHFSNKFSLCPCCERSPKSGRPATLWFYRWRAEIPLDRTARRTPMSPN